ncbi:hypothetical protein GCM10022237_35830 [Nocardioides ginsengisoli]|uniref:Lipopolysaccharide assembly protein LapA domain-containing protein n=1 Tax=Nocardioides ginsengisoli TaxID=363868 RepID=A0ABW3VYY0_9ACTN
MTSHAKPTHRDSNAPVFAVVRAPDTIAADRPVPRSRAGSAWMGLVSAVVITMALAVLMLQNTARVDISFLWMTGRTSLGLVVLIAVFAAVLMTLCLVTVRILQLRRLLKRRSNH